MDKDLFKPKEIKGIPIKTFVNKDFINSELQYNDFLGTTTDKIIKELYENREKLLYKTGFDILRKKISNLDNIHDIDLCYPKELLENIFDDFERNIPAKHIVYVNSREFSRETLSNTIFILLELLIPALLNLDGYRIYEEYTDDPENNRCCITTYLSKTKNKLNDDDDLEEE